MNFLNQPSTVAAQLTSERLKKELNGITSSSVIGQSFSLVRKSRDLKDEIMQQRMATTFRLENMNLKPPQTWKQKSEAYMRFKEMQQQMHLSGSAVSGARSPREMMASNQASPRMIGSPRGLGK